MTFPKTLIVGMVGLFLIGLSGTVHAGDWVKAPIEDLGGLLNANTDMKKPTIMELGRKGRADGHPAAWAEFDVDCAGHSSSGDHWCNIQLEIIFSKPKNHERVKIQILDGDEQALKTVYLLKPTNDDVRARVYVVGVKCVDGLKPKVRVAIKGEGKPIKGNARVTFLRADCENEDKTNWQVSSNWSLADRNGLALKRPTFLFLQ